MSFERCFNRWSDLILCLCGTLLLGMGVLIIVVVGNPAPLVLKDDTLECVIAVIFVAFFYFCALGAIVSGILIYHHLFVMRALRRKIYPQIRMRKPQIQIQIQSLD